MKADIGNWIWLAIIIFGIISKFLKSGDKRPERAEPQEPVASDAAFEELLREMEKQKRLQSVPAPAKGTEPPKKTGTSGTLLDTVIPDYQDDDTVKSYNEGVKSAFNYKSLEDTVSLEESLKLSDVKPMYKKFEEYSAESEVSLAAQYADDLRHPQGLGKAIVLSEILNRRFSI